VKPEKTPPVKDLKHLKTGQGNQGKIKGNEKSRTYGESPKVPTRFHHVTPKKKHRGFSGKKGGITGGETINSGAFPTMTPSKNINVPMVPSVPLKKRGWGGGYAKGKGGRMQFLRSIPLRFGGGGRMGKKIASWIRGLETNLQKKNHIEGVIQKF